MNRRELLQGTVPLFGIAYKKVRPLEDLLSDDKFTYRGWKAVWNGWIANQDRLQIGRAHV